MPQGHEAKCLAKDRARCIELRDDVSVIIYESCELWGVMLSCNLSYKS